MDAIFCIYIWDLKPDFKPVKLKRTNEENEKGLWWCHSYNERGRPWADERSENWSLNIRKIYLMYAHKRRVQVLRVRVLLPVPGTVSSAGPSPSSGCSMAVSGWGRGWTGGALGDQLKEDAHRWLGGAVGQHSALSCSLLGQFGKLKWLFRAFH